MSLQGLTWSYTILFRSIITFSPLMTQHCTFFSGHTDFPHQIAAALLSKGTLLPTQNIQLSPCFSPSLCCLVFSHTSRWGALPRAHTYDLYEKQLIRHINRGLSLQPKNPHESFAFPFSSPSLPDYEFGMCRVETDFINKETKLSFKSSGCPNWR